MNIEMCAVVEISGGNVHLKYSFNPDASCCTDDDTGTIVQREEYDADGWNEPQGNPLLATKFWDIWCDWNGRMCGGIGLDDSYTYAEADELEKSLPKLKPSEIATAKDGTYWVESIG